MQSVNDDIAYFKSTDGGATWPTVKTLLTNADIATGSKTIALTPNGIKTDSVTFDKPFSKAPVVIANLAVTNPDQQKITVSERGASGFTVSIQNGTSASGNVNYTWIAICI